MGIKIKDFVIQAKVNEGIKSKDPSNRASTGNNTYETTIISNVLKKEIIDECLEKMTELLDKRINRI